AGRQILEHLHSGRSFLRHVLIEPICRSVTLVPVRSPKEDDLKRQILLQIPGLRRFARYLARDADHADDLVQETLIRALGSLPQLDPDGNLRAWLFTILQNVLRGEWRRRRRSPVRQDIPIESPPEPVKIDGQVH